MKLERRPLFLVLAVLALVFAAVAPSRGGEDRRNVHRQVIVPGEDRFTPLAQTVHVNDIVQWINTDTDDHTVVSDDFVSTAGRRGLDVVLPGTDSNGGKPGLFALRMTSPGTFVYYCRFHAHLDADYQPAAPGPKGGIQDADGNYGTPMMGVITVLPND